MVKNKGFSLIEISIIMVIISLLFGMVTANLYKLDLYKAEQTRKKMEIIKDSLTSFLLTHNRLPCPANSLLPANDQNNNQEACGCNNLRVGESLNFSCVSDYYLGGSVPSAALNLPDNMIYDSWGNKFFYGVIEAVSGYNSFCQYGIVQSDYNFDSCDKGFIKIKDLNSLNVNSEAVYVIYSFGPTGKGARNSLGILNPPPTLIEEMKNYNSTLNGGEFILLPINVRDRTILAYETKNSIMAKISSFTSGEACSYAKKIQSYGPSQICVQNNVINQTCVNYSSIMNDKVMNWCLK